MLADVGGLSGIVGRIFGGAREPLAMSGAGAISPVAMTVTTPMVNISTSSLSGFPLAAGFAAAAFAPGGPSIAAAQLQSVAVGGALTGLNGPFAAQPSAMVTEAQAIFGPAAVRITSAFRTVERQAELFAQAVQKYGSEAAASRHVGRPGHSNHNHGLAADLDYGSSAVRQWFHSNASRYGLGFRMGHEPWHIEPVAISAMRAQQVLPTAQFERLATTAEMATGQLGTFGTRAETTGQGLAAMGGTFAQALQMFGGATGGSDPTRVARVVHERKFVFDAAATARIGVANLEAMRRGIGAGYQTGGYAVGGRPPVSPACRAAMASAANDRAEPRQAERVTFEINVKGAGNAEIYAATRAGMGAALEEHDREILARRVRMIVKDEWST